MRLPYDDPLGPMPTADPSEAVEVPMVCADCGQPINDHDHERCPRWGRTDDRAAMKTRCRCGHHWRAHRGLATECRGEIPAGKNAVGIKMIRRCDCKSFRQTERSWWQRNLHGTEEHPLYDADGRFVG